ncbi:hypothetical protein R3P38DRAFT_3116965 [Favolaschia claudopus]|uniref:Uncharacterized protein n=1 Tax=Favolaschia claudopus TaxID=2862362 RepID=A0AAV9ZFR4_9AGAR
MTEEFKEDTDASFKYSGSWKRQYNSMYHGSSTMRTTQLGDSMVVSFQGSAVKFMGAEGWNHGTMLVTLDGDDETTVDGYCCGTGSGTPQVIQFEATGLTSASPHILNITNLARGPYGAVVEVDAIIVTPHPYSPSWVVLAVCPMLFYFAVILLRSAFKSNTYHPLPMHPRSFSSVRLRRLEEGYLSPSSNSEPGIINIKENPPAYTYTHTPESSGEEELETPVASGSGPSHMDDALAQRLATIVVHHPRTETDAPPSPQYRDEIMSSAHSAV